MLRICIPADRSIIKEILQQVHDTPVAGHLGIDKTFELARRDYYWPTLRQDVESYVRSCDTCQRTKATNQPKFGLLQSLPIPEQRWEDISMDFIGPLPLSPQGHDAITVFVDRLTKRVHLIPSKTTDSAEDIAKIFVREIYRLHGLPKSIVSDRDARFTSEFWLSVHKAIGTTLRMSTAFHPQTDGQTERTNRTLQEIIRASIDYNQENWDLLLPLTEFAINNATSSSTGFSPFFLDTGQNPRTIDLQAVPMNTSKQVDDFLNRLKILQAVAKENLIKAQTRQTENANQSRQNPKFKTGDQVMLSTAHYILASHSQRQARKFNPRWIGPFKIIESIGTNAFRLELPKNSRIHPTVNVEHLKPFIPNDPSSFPNRSVAPPKPLIIDDQIEFEVDRILDSRQHHKRTEYLVLWKGYSLDQATWEPLTHLAHASKAIETFLQGKHK